MFVQKVYKNDFFLLFTTIYPKIDMLGQFRLSNNLLTHIRRNTDFPLKKPWQLLSAEANFEGCWLSNYHLGSPIEENILEIS